jgi:hypothetical protein
MSRFDPDTENDSDLDTVNDADGVGCCENVAETGCVAVGVGTEADRVCVAEGVPVVDVVREMDRVMLIDLDFVAVPAVADRVFVDETVAVEVALADAAGEGVAVASSVIVRVTDRDDETVRVPAPTPSATDRRHDTTKRWTMMDDMLGKLRGVAGKVLVYRVFPLRQLKRVRCLRHSCSSRTKKWVLQRLRRPTDAAVCLWNGQSNSFRSKVSGDIRGSCCPHTDTRATLATKSAWARQQRGAVPCFPPL